MATPRQLATVIAGTTSIIAVQLFGVFNSPQSYSLGDSRDVGFLTSVFANLPASAESNSPRVPLVDKNFLVSQARGSRIRFVPPADKSTRRSQGSGSRGCEESLPVNLVTLLIPSKEYIGQTVSGHPTFFWNLSKPVSVPMKFTLMEPGVAKPLYVKQMDSPKVGIIQMELPKDLPELVAGRKYGWSVTLVCNPRRPSANPYFYSWIERVSATPALEQQLAAATSQTSSPPETLRKRALIYAQAGLWYNSLADISTALTANPNNSSVQEDFLDLLAQVGLTEVAKQEQQRLAKN
jgi:hypothetical protein